LVGKNVGLRPIMPSDYALLQMLETNGEVGARWRFRGQTMSPEQWSATLWQGVLAQFLVFAHGQELPIGMVKAYRASFQDRTAYIGGLRFDVGEESALMMRGFALFIEYVFRCFDFRKLYLESPSYNVGQFASGIGRYFEVEGQYKDHFEYG